MLLNRCRRVSHGYGYSEKNVRQFSASYLIKTVSERFDSIQDLYLLPIDGTGLFYSGTCRCDDCCIKNEGKKNQTFYHNIIGGCIIHPPRKTVIPLAPEAICRQDGSTKNDCEKAAIRRFLAQTKQDHPRLKLVILLDGLSFQAVAVDVYSSGVAAAVRYPVTNPTARLPDKTGQTSLIPVAWNFTGLTRSYSIVAIPKRFSNWKQGGPPNKPCSHLPPQQPQILYPG